MNFFNYAVKEDWMTVFPLPLMTAFLLDYVSFLFSDEFLSWMMRVF
jgi:hypothetical protein